MVDDVGHMHFRRMDTGTDADFAVLKRVHEENIRKLPDLLMGLLTNLKADEAYPVDRLEHSLQAATRAARRARRAIRGLRPAPRHRGVARAFQSRRGRVGRAEAVRLRGESLDDRAPPGVPGLLLRPTSRHRPERA